MTTQRFPLAAIQQVRQHIQNSLVADVEKSQRWMGLNEIDEIPEPKSIDELSNVFTFGGLSSDERMAPHALAGWSVSTVNPAAALLQLPGLKLKPGWRLAGYLYQAEYNQPANQAAQGNTRQTNSIGLVFAIPELKATTAQLERALAQSQGIKQPPRPDGGLSNFMQAIEGDRSIISFMVASLFWRELREFGASGAYCRWSHHRLINQVPTQAQWNWKTEVPKDLHPKAKILPNGQAVVEFFSCSVRSEVALYRHIDQYPADQYSLKQIDQPIAVIQPSAERKKF